MADTLPAGEASREVIFEISYISGNIALAPGSEHIVASLRKVLRSYQNCYNPCVVFNRLIRSGGFYEDLETELTWIPLSAVVRVERLIQ